MAQKVIMPQMGESVVQGTIAKWLVKEGDPVKVDQPLVEVSTDKVDVEIPSPGEGILSQILVNEGQTVDIGVELAVIVHASPVDNSRTKSLSTPAEQVAPALDDPKREPLTQPSSLGPNNGKQQPHRQDLGKDRQRLSPVVRRLAGEYGIDLSNVKGTGLEGRITKEDILRYVGKGGQERREVKSGKEVKSDRTPVAPTVGYQAPRYEAKGEDQVIPFTRMRGLIADHMVASKRIAPHVTTVTEVDFSKLVTLRNQKKKEFKEKEGVSLTFLPFVVTATVKALKEYSLLNASVVDHNIILKKEINMGIAVETEEGLIVPVVRQADGLSLFGMAKVVGELAIKARKRELLPQDIAGGTFTITNPGKNGNLFGTPILFQPQVGILRMGEVIRRPMVIQLGGEEAIAIRSMMYLSLSYDHRIIDGATGNNFLHRVKELLEEDQFGL